MENTKARNILLTFPVVVAIVLVFALNPSSFQEPNNNPPVVVIRIDDVQDYAFKKGQLYLLDHSQQNNYPLSLAVIPYYFGHDTQLVRQIKQSITKGSEIAVHGWAHENLSSYSYEEQKTRLTHAKQTLQEVLNLDATVLVPPMFMYNNDTVTAMDQTGYTIVSGLTEFHTPQWVSQNVQSIPATIELCDFSNNSWVMKEPSEVISELKTSIQNYGYAIIVTHPQEFMTDLELNPQNTKKYEELFTEISKEYSFCTIENLELTS